MPKTKDRTVEAIKKHLWMWGFRVTDMTGRAPYDLLVEGQFKLKVHKKKVETLPK